MADKLTKVLLTPVYKEEHIKFEKPVNMNVLFEGEGLNVLPLVKSIDYSIGKISMDRAEQQQFFAFNIESSREDQPRMLYSFGDLSKPSVLYPITTGMVLNINGEVVGEKVDEKDIRILSPQKKVNPFNHSFDKPRELSICMDEKIINKIPGVVCTVTITRDGVENDANFIIDYAGIEKSEFIEGITFNATMKIPQRMPTVIKEVFIREEASNDKVYIQFLTR